MSLQYGAVLQWLRSAPQAETEDGAKAAMGAERAGAGEACLVVVDDYAASDLPPPTAACDGGGGGGGAAASATAAGQSPAHPAEDWSLVRLPPSREDCMAAADSACRAEADSRGPLSVDEWRAVFAADGSLQAARWKDLERRIFATGLAKEVRAEAWRYLLDYRKFDRPEGEQLRLIGNLREEYAMYVRQWSSFTPTQLKRFRSFREAKDVIEKDVRRTDRSLPEFEQDESEMLQMLHRALMTHAVYNVDLGYTQGMNDRLALILLLMHDEADAFWCFEGLLAKLPNYFEPGSPEVLQLKTQLSNLLSVVDPELSEYFENPDHDLLLASFAYSRFLLHFKRDFDPADAMRLWEAIWTCPHTSFFHVFVAAAMLVRVRADILGKDISEVMNLFQKHFEPGDVEELLQRATWLFHYYQALKACNRDGPQSCPASIT